MTAAACLMLVATLGVAGIQTALAVDALADRLLAADVVFLDAPQGEAGAARTQGALLGALATRRGDITLVFGRLPRQAQDPLDHFQMGHMNDHELLGAVGPWPGYERDYKPIVDAAVANEWFLMAGGPPQGEDDASGDRRAETVAQAHAAGSLRGKRLLIIVIDGFSQNVVAQTRRRLPDRRIETARIRSSATEPSTGADYQFVVDVLD